MNSVKCLQWHIHMVKSNAAHLRERISKLTVGTFSEPLPLLRSPPRSFAEQHNLNPRDYARRGIEPVKMKGLIDLIADIGFKGNRNQARDTLG